MRLPTLLCFVAICSVVTSLAEDTVLTVDFSDPRGTIRPLHGINKGPLAPGGLFDVIPEHKALAIPSVRLHDCGWPNPYVVDHHAVFPNPAADPSLPESYDFRLTDEYIAAVRATGAEPIYRLGESIEHTTVKRYARVPADMEKWTAICLGIIRHYNEGWANGFHHGIRYWEIWNEPENRPVMWDGTDEDFLRLYRTAATAIKREFPTLKVGGPAFGASGSFVDGKFQPTAFVEKFLTMCRQDGVPLNFFSWHCYTADPAELTARAFAIRALLNSYGFTETESHLNEWNYLPGNSWKPISRGGTAVGRQEYFASMAGAPGAAFIVAGLLRLQDAPVDVGNFFHGELGAFGLFSEQGVPLKSYHALRAFRQLLDTPQRVATTGTSGGKLAFASGLNADRRQATVLLSNHGDPRTSVALHWKNLPWSDHTLAEIQLLDSAHNLTVVRGETLPPGSSTLTLDLPAPAVALIRLQPSAPPASAKGP